MFRERRQKKNIMSLGIILLVILLSVFVFPIETGSAYVNDDIAVSVLDTESIETPVVEQEENHLEENNITSSTNEIKESEVIEYPVDAQNGVYAVPSVNTNFKSFTYYTSLSKSSRQGRLQKIAYTDENGLRKVDKYYCAAMGSYYSTTIGDLFRITTSDNNVFEIIICDVKADIHTDANNMYTVSDNSLVEFYVDKTTLNSAARVRGSISAIEGFSGSIVRVESLGYYKWE